ncbi:alpha/beta hydrolase [Luethyella okanaganae]|uniref:Alpha/beta hydrolase n=1 Tax=Luethyella okanaganae TaxID=69372 RepID=A0ABW1VFT3_9MICO
MHIFDSLLDLDISTGPVIVAAYALSAAALAYLLFRRRTAVWFFIAIIAIVAGALIGLLVLWLAVDVFDSFGSPVAGATYIWVPAAFAGFGLAVVNLRGSRWWRTLVATLSILLFGVTATLSVNDAYGLSPTLGAFLHISTAKPVGVGTPKPLGATDPTEPLFYVWKPPMGMPPTGKIGSVEGDIPNTNSLFPARPAQIYLPPAAQVQNAPKLPLVIMMLGQPGDPDPRYIAKVLDGYAAGNNGLAPIALVVDQLSDPLMDPLCLDSPLGDVETYLMKDVVPWARENLAVLQSPRYWTVAGYSNGGECAAYFGSKYPDTFGNLLAISPNEYAGAEQNDVVLSSIFAGDQAAYDAVKPAVIMASRAPYLDTTAVFTAGASDSDFSPGTQRLADAAMKAGMKTTFYSVPDADHGVSGLNGGLAKGFESLYPRLGLSAPAS